MNAPMSSSHLDLWVVAGWTMIHFLWLGTLVALAALLSRWLLRRASANVRYVTALACLATLAALPVAIATWLHQNSSPIKEEIRNGFVGVDAQVHETPLAQNAPIDLALEASSSTTTQPLAGRPTTTVHAAEAAAAPTIVGSTTADPLTVVVSTLNTFVKYLPWLWLFGTPITFALTATGLLGTRRLRQASQPITDGPIVEALVKLAASLQLTRRVGVAVCDRIAAPVLLGILRPVILLPPAALTGYSPDEIEMVLLHELAHVRRWDTLVNLVQRLVESLLFFHPAVWLISSWVRREREACCDALVVTRTERPHAYAELLVALAARMPRSVLFHPVASSAMAAGPLRSRIRRILQLDDDPMLVSGKSFAIVLASLLTMATVVGIYLPTKGHAEPSESKLRQNADEQNNESIASIAAKFPHVVHFEKGAAKFLDGDSISIDEIRGTADTFMPGNRYWIKGTYKLKSHDRAQISAFTIAANAEDGTEPILAEQTKQIGRGERAFTLILPMSVRGWPHLSFYPADGGGDFGGIYFGTGDSVLKKWWDSTTAAEHSGGVKTGNRDEIEKTLQNLQREIARKYEDYIDIAKSGRRDPETDLLLRDIADTQAKVQSLTKAYYQLQADYLVARSELSDPALVDVQAEEALKHDAHYAELAEKVKSQTAPSDGSEYLAAEKYRAEFKKKAIQEIQAKPNVPLQQLTQRFNTNAASLRKQRDLLTQSLEEKKKELHKRLDNLADLGKRGDELKEMQQLINDTMAKLSELDSDAQPELIPFVFALKHDGSGRTQLYMNGQPVAEDVVRATLGAQGKFVDALPVSLSADQSVSYADVMKVIDLIESLGVKKLALDTRLTEARASSVAVGAEKTKTDAVDVAPAAATGSKAATELVLAEFPVDWPGGGEDTDKAVKKFVDGYTQGYLKKLRVDLVPRGGKLLLVGVAQPTEKDWPAILGEPPLKQRVLGERIWQALGLKVVPLNRAETINQELGSLSGGVLIVGGNVPKGLPLPVLLNNIDGQKVSNMDEVLGQVGPENASPTQHRCHAAADNNEYLFDSQPPTANKPVVSSQAKDDVTQTTTSTRFPSLENQKLADLVWKRLGLELEPIVDEDMKRVKALGYEGGLRLSGPATAAGTEPDNTAIIWQSGDVLVGLHVWPTTSLKDIGQILSRDDLTELSPLKYYVVTREAVNVPNQPNKATSKDIVRTGRILVRETQAASTPSKPKKPAPAFEQNSPAKPLSATDDWLPTPATSSSLQNLRDPYKAPVATLRPGTNTSNSPYNSPPLLALPGETTQPPLPRSAEEHSKMQAERVQQLISIAQAAAPHSVPPAGTVTVPKVEQVVVNERHNVPVRATTSAQPTTTPVPPTPAQDAKELKPAGSESVIVAHEIPAELEKDVRQYVDRLRDSKVRTSWDDRGRLIMQASQERQDELEKLLKFTAEWRQSIAKKEIAGRTGFDIRKVDDTDVLDLHAAGLSFVHDGRRNRSTPSMPGGVCVKEVVPGSPAAWIDVRPGDILDRVGPFQATNVSELASIFKTLQEGTAADRKLELLFYRRKTDGSGAWVGGQLPLIGETDEATLPRERRSWRSEKSRRESSSSATAPSPGNTPAPTPSAAPSRSGSINKANLFYDGKTFDVWRSAWQTELSTEKRIEAVKALAAFGANGYGREAAQSIFDVADQYEWVRGTRADGVMEREPLGKLQQAVFNALAGTPGGARIAPAYWLPLLKQRYEGDPAKWQSLVLLLLQSSASSGKQNDDVRSLLFSLAKGSDESVSSQAYDILVRLFPDDEELTKLLTQLFHDKSHWISAVRWIGRTPQYPPEVIELFLHGDQKQQADARRTFAEIPSTPAKKALVATMVAILKDDSKSADHIAAIRTLAVLGETGSFGQSEAPQLLNEILKKGPLEKQVAAAFALQYSTRGRIQTAGLLAEFAHMERVAAQSLLNKESDAFNGK